MKQKTVSSKKVLAVIAKQKAAIAVIFMLAAMIFIPSSFYSRHNLLNLLRDSSVMLIISFGVTLTIVAGGCDLSVGGNMCLSGIVAIMMINSGMSIPLAVILTVLLGAVIGLFNGFLAVHQKTEAFIITLGTGMLFKGLCELLTDAHPISCAGSQFMQFANGKLFGVIYNIVIWMLFLGIGVYALLRFTGFGRNLYAIGGDYSVAVYSGIKVVKTKWLAFILCGAMTAFAGVLLSSRMNTGSAIYGDSTALMVNCGCVVGGTSFAGGRGGIVQTVVGMFVLTILQNAMNVLGLPAYVQQLSQGIIIVMILWSDSYGRKRQREAV